MKLFLTISFSISSSNLISDYILYNHLTIIFHKFYTLIDINLPEIKLKLGNFKFINLNFVHLSIHLKFINILKIKF